MELKDKLRKLRKERGISQQRLAEEIFVSRSAVAKWENGLGVPGQESLDALCKYFNLGKEYFVTDEPELLIVEKNKKLYAIKNAVIFCIMLLVAAVIIGLSVNILYGNYGFTSEMAAGPDWADNKCIHTKDYDFYYYSWDEGEEYEWLANFRPVRKKWYGYVVSKEDYEYRRVYDGDKKVALIYTMKGKDCYYNIITKVSYISEGSVYFYPEYFMMFDSVNVNGREYPVTLNSYFVTEEEFDTFSIGDVVLTIEE